GLVAISQCQNSEGQARPSDHCCPARVRSPTTRTGRPSFRPSPATRGPLGDHRSCRKGWPRSHSPRSRLGQTLLGRLAYNGLWRLAAKGDVFNDVVDSLAMTPLVTSQAANDIQLLVLMKMTGIERLRIAMDLSEMARKLAFARIEKEQPGLSRQLLIRQ